jgi:hypothetical protein
MTINEARAIVAAYDTSRRGALTMNDFMHFLFTDAAPGAPDASLFSDLETRRSAGGSLDPLLRINLQERALNRKTSGEVNALKLGVQER